MTYTATYSPDDNKLRLYASQRLDADTYARVKAAGFRWAPKQDLFVAPAWSPERAALCVELAGQIDDDDQTLMDRAEERADRFTDYHAARTRDAEQAHKAVETIAQGIPLGQPILIGHHSERHARKDAERIESGMKRAIRAFDTAEYWTRRAAGSLYHAKYKERPDVRARRIKTLEAEARKVERSKTEHNSLIRLWRQLDTVKRKDGAPTTQHDRASMIANVAGGYYSFPLADYPRAASASQYEGAMSIWSALGETPAEAVITPEQARDLAITTAEAGLARCEEWIAHLSGRLAYERAMLADAGGTVADKTGPENGGACRCWATDRGRNRWSTIQKVNQISVTVLDTWNNGGADFTRTIPFDKLTAIMSRADVEAARAAGRIIDETPRGFALLDVSPTPEPPATTDTPEPVETLADKVETLRGALAAGIQTITAPTLYPTPIALAAEMIARADIQPGHRVLEPSAGTGRLIDAMPREAEIVAVEFAPALAAALRTQYAERATVHCADFTERYSDTLGTFDRVVMNPPFDGGADMKHIERALALLRPGGRLVALCAAGPRQRARYVDTCGFTWEDLPAGSFAEAGTGINVAMITFTKETPCPNS